MGVHARGREWTAQTRVDRFATAIFSRVRQAKREGFKLGRFNGMQVKVNADVGVRPHVHLRRHLADACMNVWGFSKNAPDADCLGRAVVV